MAALSAESEIGSVWRLVSDYDEVTDKSLPDLQEKTDDFIESMEKVSGKPEGALDTHADFYETISRTRC